MHDEHLGAADGVFVTAIDLTWRASERHICQIAAEPLRDTTRQLRIRADALLAALDAEQDLVALSIDDREAILRVLDDPPN